jgi:hypothetical protein
MRVDFAGRADGPLSRLACGQAQLLGEPGRIRDIEDELFTVDPQVKAIRIGYDLHVLQQPASDSAIAGSQGDPLVGDVDDHPEWELGVPR